MAALSGAGHPNQNPHGRNLWKLSLGALGIVYGDIGTSPLYALKESFAPAHGLALTDANVFGILSLVFWSLLLVVTVKYLGFILRADNAGEGGITSLLALLTQKRSESKLPPEKGAPAPREYRRVAIIILGLFGAGLLYGEGIITPAISVLSAIEGLEVASPLFRPLVVPLTVVVLVALFLVQKGGTARIGAIFGPVTLVWFITLSATGIFWILKVPAILGAVNPLHAVKFFAQNGWLGFLTLSSVVLCITGAEALYADMGHFGRKPIRLGWFAVVFPALLLNYFGQGALVLEKGDAVIGNTFYGLVQGGGPWLLYPVIAIATAATIIASQALISGAFSLTQQTLQLGYLPRMTIRHTSRETEGQIYVPRVNAALMISCIALVLTFQNSTNLAAAYGIAVTATMVISSLLFYRVTQEVWHWARWKAVLLVSLFLVVDLAFFSANLNKLASGGWIPIVIAAVLLTVMLTWKRGREEVSKLLISRAISLDDFLSRIQEENPHRVNGTAVFMTLTQNVAPSVLLHHYEHNRSLHKRVILLSILTEHAPAVPGIERVRVTDLSEGFVKVVARYGYMENPDMSEILASCEGAGMVIDYHKLSFYLGRESFSLSGKTSLPRWRKSLFVFLSRNARSASEFFALPPDQVIEIGSRLKL